MSRAQIKVEAGESFPINGVTYRVAEHPALPGIPYVQRGARGFVIQLIAPNDERMALKYFKLKYRVPDLVKVAEGLKHYADLPGLRAARRTVFTKESLPALLVRYPALEYGVLMPWLPGTTWYDLVTTKAPMSAQESIKLAQATSQILATFEARGLAHCDIAGANVIVERKGPQIELVDIEEMFGPKLPAPVEFPAGQDGYQHRTSRQYGQWSAVGDRFGAAVLLAEMLGWADGRVRQNSADEHYFSANEMQDPDSPRFRLLYEVLRDDYAPELAEAFKQAWHSGSLADCPTIASWRDLLLSLKGQEKSATPAASPVVRGRRAIGSVTVLPPTPEQGKDHIRLEGTRLCRNCGTQNALTETYCKRCGFYIAGIARPTVIPSPTGKSTNAASSPTNPLSSPTTGTAPQPVALQQDNDAIISARRLGTGEREVRHEYSPGTAKPDAEGNFGQWIVIALVIGAILAVIIFALVGAGPR